MDVAQKSSSQRVTADQPHRLPDDLRVLYISGQERTGSWLAEAFAADSATKVVLEEAAGCAAGLTRLGEESFDAVLLSHEPGCLDALELVEGYRAGGADEPVVILGLQGDQDLTPLCFEAGADAYVCVHTTTTRTLIWIIARAIQRHRMARENQRLQHAEQRRIAREHDEARQVIGDQRALLERSPQRGDCPEAAAGPLPESLVRHYRELLRAYVIMGSGSLSGELWRLAEVLAAAGVSTLQAMHLHLAALEELLDGLGARSTRHVMTRADLLALEVTVHLGETYRRRCGQGGRPAEQRLPPDLASPASSLQAAHRQVEHRREELL